MHNVSCQPPPEGIWLYALEHFTNSRIPRRLSLSITYISISLLHLLLLFSYDSNDGRSFRSHLQVSIW
jgi:hypothetical protein